MAQELPSDFPARVRAARGYAGLSQPKFGEKVRRSATTVGNWEDGTHTPDSDAIPSVVKNLAQASGLPEWFFTIQRLDSLRMAGAQTPDQRLSQIEEKVGELQVEIAAAEVEAQRRHDEAIAAIRRLQPPPQP